MKDNALISVRGLEKSFGKDIQVLKGIDIDIFKGDVVVVLVRQARVNQLFSVALTDLKNRQADTFSLRVQILRIQRLI